jgi:UDP-N-acetylglucosamine:LPS N-acetylglucosamine transferase
MRGIRDPRFARRFTVFRGGHRGRALWLGTAVTLVQWIWILLVYRPDVIFSTGSELAVIPFYLGRYVFGARCIFLETGEQHDFPTGTARLVYRAAHVVFVQSEALLAQLGPKARFAGSLL